MKLFQVKILCSSRSTLFARLSILTFDVKTDAPMNLTQRNLVTLCAPMNFIVEPINEHQTRKTAVSVSIDFGSLN